MADNVVVSVVMAVFNGGRTIETAIESVLSQTHSNFELIVCDDGSVDDTQEKIASFEDERIVLLVNDRAYGPGPARDRAVSVARGAWLAVIDADDAWHPERLERMLGVAAGEQVMVFDDLLQCHDTPNGMVPWSVLRGKSAFGGGDGLATDVPLNEYLLESRLLIKPLIPMQVIRVSGATHGRYRFGEDTHFYLQALSTGIALRYVPDALYFYRITPGSLTSWRGRDMQMKMVLNDLRSQLNSFPQVLTAIDRKIALLQKQEEYVMIANYLRTQQFGSFISSFRSFGWFFPMLLRRFFGDMRYKMHERKHATKRWGEE